MKKLLMIAAIALMAVACNKNQAAVKKLDGKWKATIITTTISGITFDLIATGAIKSAEFTFENCKLKKDELCNATYTEINALDITTVDSSLYKVTEEGTKIETQEDPSSTTITAYEILDLTNSLLKVRRVIDGVTYDMTMAKQ